jgi:hypothetical protein
MQVRGDRTEARKSITRDPSGLCGGFGRCGFVETGLRLARASQGIRADFAEASADAGSWKPD